MVSHAEEGGERDLAAGDFSSWVTDMQAAIRGDRAADVPCAGCTACCTSSQFVHIGPDETETRAHIPTELLFAAPQMPAGHVVLGYDEHGHCPMLVDNACSIYEHRPETCRTYDCRVFAAAGLEPDENAQADITLRVRRWRFSYPAPVDELRQAAVRAAAAYVDERNATQRAVRAVEIHEQFLEDDPA